MKKIVFGFFLVALVCCWVLCPGLSVFAQEDDADTFMLEEVTVTAEKREVNVQKSALSVTAVTGANIRDKAQNTLQDVLRDVASVEVGFANRGGQINIRGVGSYVDTSLADPAVAVIEDNIYNGNSLATFANMYDIDRVEVLRGPQGTLYGRNATGGTVNVISKNPQHEFELQGNFQIGDYNLKHFDGAVNFPLSDAWAARVSLLRETRDGYISSGDMDANTFGTRTKLLYEPGENFSVLATYEYFWQKDHGSNTVPLPDSAGNLPRLGPPPNFGWTVPDVDNDGVADDFLDANGDTVTGGNGTPDIIDTGWIVPEGADPWTNDEWHPAGSSYVTKRAYSVQIDYDFGWSQLTAIPSYADSYNHNVDNHLAGIAQSEDGTLGEGQKNTRKQTSGEVRLASPAESDLVWVVGGYYMKSDNSRPDEQDVTTYDDNDWHFQTEFEPNTTTALFGQTTIPITDWFRVTGGIRYSTDELKKDYRYGNSQLDSSHPLYADTNGTGVYDSGWLTYSQDVDSTTYKGGVEFDLTEDSMLYAQVATGFKQGGLNDGAPPEEFLPEELTAYEIGSKNRFLDNRIQLNLEAFYYEYDNFQAQLPSPVAIGDTGGMGFIMAIANAGESTLQGADLELDYLLTTNDLVKISASYLDSEVGEFIIPGPNPFGLEADFDMTGRKMSSSPEWAFTVAIEHTWNLDDGGTVTGRLDSKISDGYWRTLEQWLPYAWEDGYTRSNFNVTYRTVEEDWSVSVWGNNLENDAQYTWAVPFYRAQIKAPRTFGVSISYRY